MKTHLGCSTASPPESVRPVAARTRRRPHDDAYDAAGNMTSMNSAIDGSTTFSSNANGQLTAAAYDTAGNLLPNNEGATNESYTYDANGDRVDSTSPSSSTAASCTTGTGNACSGTAPTPTSTTAMAT